MKKNIFTILFSLFFVAAFSQKPFKKIAYYVPRLPVSEIPFKYLTHINYSFAIPAPIGDTLLPLKNDTALVELVKVAKLKKVKVFISIGGWSVGDGGGEDGRFHRMAETETGRKAFIASTMAMVNKYKLDGVDLDWEYPDENHRSADDYVLLCKELYKQLHAQNKQLTAAVVSAGKKAYGIKNEVYKYMDWLNIMVYDGDYGPAEVKHHSPYSMAVRCLDFWLNERKLPAQKCVLGLPFYAKKGHGNFGYNYKKLLEEGASPLDDYWNGHYYNGKITIANKTKLALNLKCAGVMVWEMSHDTADDNSLFKVIDDVSKGRKGW
ncbi:MAG: glycosyl hydrolase family 18 protein [Bacteroidota bacterium]